VVAVADTAGLQEIVGAHLRDIVIARRAKIPAENFGEYFILSFTVSCVIILLLSSFAVNYPRVRRYAA